jgi:CTP synthase
MRFRHRYEVEPRFVQTLEDAGLVFSGVSPNESLMNILELPPELHPYYVGVQAHPELTSRPLAPQPLFLGLVHACLRRAYADYTQTLVYAAEETRSALTPAPSAPGK